ncbi:MAG: HAD family hydrolase [Halodesulfurarchaeum sp.]
MSTHDGPIEAVFWDIGGVILDVESVRRAHGRFVAALLEEHPASLTHEEAVDRWRETVSEYFADRAETEFRPAREAYHRAVDSILDEQVPRSKWEPRFRSILESSIEPHPDAIEALEAMTDDPVHVGVISDVDRDEGRRILEHFGVSDQLDSYTCSEAVGRTKPHPSMFETGLEAAGVPPAHAAMIGDRYRHDMLGAKRVGMVTVAYGAESGDAVDYRTEDLREVRTLLGLA